MQRAILEININVISFGIKQMLVVSLCPILNLILLFSYFYALGYGLGNKSTQKSFHLQESLRSILLTKAHNLFFFGGRG